jgi:hypothetical protein
MGSHWRLLATTMGQWASCDDNVSHAEASEASKALLHLGVSKTGERCLEPDMSFDAFLACSKESFDQRKNEIGAVMSITMSPLLQ